MVITNKLSISDFMEKQMKRCLVYKIRTGKSTTKKLYFKSHRTTSRITVFTKLYVSILSTSYKKTSIIYNYNHSCNKCMVIGWLHTAQYITYAYKYYRYTIIHYYSGHTQDKNKIQKSVLITSQKQRQKKELETDSNKEKQGNHFFFQSQAIFQARYETNCLHFGIALNLSTS